MSEDKRRDLRDVLDELDKYFEDFEKDVEDAVKNSIFGTSRSAKPIVAGFSYNIGPERKPSLQIFGDSPVHRDGFRAPINEQVVDEHDGVLRMILEMPGVEKDDIRVAATEDTAVITTEKGDRRYRAELKLRVPVKPDSGKAEYKYGVLEILYSLKDKANMGFRRVNVA